MKVIVLLGKVIIDFNLTLQWYIGNVFPIWATCMSYEMLVLIITQNPKILNNFDSNNHPLNTTILPPSQLYNAIPLQYHEDIEKKEAFFYNHMYGLKPETFANT